LLAVLQATLEFNSSNYLCGTEVRFFAWALNEVGISDDYGAYSDPVVMPDCPA
jgi:hypothetical protein